MIEKPTAFAEDLFTFLVGTFPTESELAEVIKILDENGITNMARMRRHNVDSLVAMKMRRGYADDIVHALNPATSHTPQQPAAPQGDSGLTGVVSTLTSTLTSLLGGKLEELPMDKLLDRLIETGASDPTVISFAAESHVLLSKRGVVLKPGTEKIIDKAATLDYYRQPRSYLGDRWKNQRVVPVTGAFGVKEEFNPFNLNQPLQGGVDPNTDLDLNGVSAPVRNFLSFVAETKPNLVKDDGHALVEAIKEKGGLEGLKSHGRFGKVVTAYEEACGDDVSIATKYLPALYRTPGDTRPSALEGAHGDPFAVAGDMRSPTARTIRLHPNVGESGPFTAKLRRLLCELVSDTKAIRQIADDLGLSSRVELDGPAEIVWGNLMREAKNLGDLPTLVGIMFSKFPNDTRFNEFLVNDSANKPAAQTPNRDAIYTRMCGLLDSQFGTLVLHLGIPTHLLPGAMSPLATRADAVLRYCENGIGLAQLDQKLTEIIRGR